ncbi:hypothetical protein [Shimia sp. SK013]|uniref:hypothetical protein n=1 Tax=Shimia sp. SK013 TaxID=1389006 RepID=UPI0006B64C58|nr:hypothetical protein [Shimia sp. SK013]
MSYLKYLVTEATEATEARVRLDFWLIYARTLEKYVTEFAEPQANFEALCREAKSLPDSSNEANTRFKILDRLLYDCLAWSKEEAEREKSQGQEYTDYELQSPPIAILEAKKVGLTFSIPVSKRPSLYRPVKDIAAASVECEKAINQA